MVSSHNVCGMLVLKSGLIYPSQRIAMVWLATWCVVSRCIFMPSNADSVFTCNREPFAMSSCWPAVFITRRASRTLKFAEEFTNENEDDAINPSSAAAICKKFLCEKLKEICRLKGCIKWW